MAKVWIQHSETGGRAFVNEAALPHYLPNGWVPADPPPAKKQPAKKAAPKAPATSADKSGDETPPKEQ